MPPQADPTTEQPVVRRRLVGFFCGFDPQGSAHYHNLFVSEGTKQADVSGYQLHVGARKRAGEHAVWWPVDFRASADEPEVHTRYEFLRWDDIVRAHWPRSRWGLIDRTIFATAQMWRNGVMWHAWRTSWPAFVAMGAPGGLLLGLSLAWTALLSLSLYLLGNMHPALGVALLSAGSAALAALGLWGERHTHMDWLMRSLASLVLQGQGEIPELDERLDAFARRMARVAREESYDEILLVGHSSGAMLTMSLMARVLSHLADSDSPPEHSRLPAMSLLTLAHCTPLLSRQPQAQRFRTELQQLAMSQNLNWVDYSAPPDGCCYALVNPAQARDVQLRPGDGPKLLNPRFSELFTPQAYRSLRRDKFRCHFQYMMSGEKPGSYDFFRIVSGPQTLAQYHVNHRSVTDFRQFQCFGGPGP